MIPSLVAGRVDIITGGMYILKARCKNIDFSEPIGQFGNAFIVPKGNPKKLQNYEDIKKSGAVMAVPTGYVMVKEARKVGIAEGKIMKVPGTTEVLAAVRSGRADIGAMTAVEADKIARETGVGRRNRYQRVAQVDIQLGRDRLSSQRRWSSVPSSTRR